MKKNEIPSIVGRHPVMEALQSGQSIDKVILQEGVRGELEKELRHLTKERQIPMQIVPKERLNRDFAGNHQGVVAIISPIPFYKLEDVLPDIFEQGKLPLIVVADGVTDVRNIGAIARSAVCCGAQTLVIGVKKSATINAEAVKSSAGAITRLPVCRENSLVNAIELLQNSGIAVLASDLHAEKTLSQMQLNRPVAFVLGSEGEGINPAIRRQADEAFIIPQESDMDSFNVSVAAGIMLYEAMRQRREG